MDTALTVPETEERHVMNRHRYVRTEGERARDLEEVSTMYLRGLKPGEIAAKLVERHQYTGLSARTIEEDLKELRQLWVNSALIKYDEAKAREIARIDELEAAAWDAWNRSWGSKDTIVDEDIDDRFGHKDDTEEESSKKPSTYIRRRTTKTTKELLGDPRYLDKIAWCIDQRCKILGLHEPMRLAISWQTEAQKAGLTEEQAVDLYQNMVTKTTKQLRDAWLAQNQVEIPPDVLEAEFEDASDDDEPDPDAE